MNRKIRWVTQTAILLALLVTLQAVTKGFGQIVTGSCVNAVLAVAALVGGIWSGVTVALVSPLLAFLLGIAPQIVTVPAIMAGNTVFVVALHFLAGPKGQSLSKQITAWLVSAAAKFVTLYILVVHIICGYASSFLLASGIMQGAMLGVLPATFSWPQLVTALIGGGIALVIVPAVRKALRR